MELDLIAKDMIKNFSFKYDTIKNATKVIIIGDYKIEYNATTLHINHHNLEENRILELKKNIRMEFEKYIHNVDLKKKNSSREMMKEMKERYILNRFIELNKEYSEFTINKKERPDFVLYSNDIKVGVEITELTTESEKVMDSISNRVFGNGLTIYQMEKLAKDKYGNRALDYKYYDVNGLKIIGTNSFEVENSKDVFVKNIEKKFMKYENDAIKFDKFIVLCFADGIEITCDRDADELLGNIKYLPKNDMFVALLYNPNDSVKFDGTICKINLFKR